MAATTDAQQHLDAVVPEGVVARDLGEHGHVEFVETPRRGYTLVDRDGRRRRLVGVTTALNALAKPALLRWSETQGARGAIEAVRHGLIDPSTVDLDDVADIVRANKLGADAAKKRAADRGLDVHGALEFWCEHGDLPPVTELRMDARPYLRGLAMWLLHADPTPVHVERIVCHPRLRYGGRFDLLCEIGGLRAIVDLKSSAGGVPYSSAHFQLEAYRAAEEEIGEEPVAQVLAVGVSPAGEFSAVPCAVPPGGFEPVMEIYRRELSIQTATRNHLKAAKEASA